MNEWGIVQGVYIKIDKEKLEKVGGLNEVFFQWVYDNDIQEDLFYVPSDYCQNILVYNFKLEGEVSWNDKENMPDSIPLDVNRAINMEKLTQDVIKQNPDVEHVLNRLTETIGRDFWEIHYGLVRTYL